MFINLKLHSLNKIILKKIIKHVIVKTNQTYTGRSSFQWVSHLRLNGSCYKGIILDVVASHLMTPCHESMLMPQVPILGQHLRLVVISITPRRCSSDPALTTCNRLSPKHLHKLTRKKLKYFY
jgi:hypothetical protein